MKKVEFDPKKQITIIEDFIKDYFIENGTPETKAVIGISGGKDSTIAATLLTRVLGPERVIGVLMPDGNQPDIDDAHEICEILGIKKFIINISNICDELYTSVIANTGFQLTTQITSNAPARIRMNVLYMVAAQVGGRVCHTGNASEMYIGYTTKYGDLAGDFSLFKNLTVRDIYAIGDVLELPKHLVHKTPGDGMSGMSDEAKTGVPYDAIDDYLIDNIVPEYIIYDKMVNAHKRNRHKEIIKLPAPYRHVGLRNQSDCWAF